MIDQPDPPAPAEEFGGDGPESISGPGNGAFPGGGVTTGMGSANTET
jgi:hypothetical protein